MSKRIFKNKSIYTRQEVLQITNVINKRMSRLITAIFQPLKAVTRSAHFFTQPISANTTSLVKPELPLLSFIRSKVRCYFPRPSEVKRVRRHGWKTRMSTPNGRRIIMRRLLKGCHVLSH
ncbi:unnamed protein product, partial [Brenthis ino]